MKTAIGIVLLTSLLMYLGGFNITLKPFHIEFPHWQRIIGWVAVCAGVSILTSDSSTRNYVNGYNQGAKDFSKQFIDKVGDKYYLIEKDSVISQDQYDDDQE